MKFNRRHTLTLAVSVLLVAGLQLTKGLSFDEKIPLGYPIGKVDAVYGTYCTRMSESARPYQARQLNLENRAYGMAKASYRDPVQQAKLLYSLEAQLIRLAMDIADAPASQLTPFERDALLYSTVRAYELARRHGERIFEEMIRFIDVQIPGPNGLQHRYEMRGTGQSAYEANYRSDENLTKAERAKLYKEMEAKFLAKGGSLKEIETLTEKVIRRYSPYTRVEYVWLTDGTVKVTEGGAGHVLLAGGQTTMSAGQMVFVKNRKGQIVLLVVSNSSGNYKPDILSARRLSAQLAAEYKIPQELIVVTKGEPMSPQPIKIFLKGRGAAPEKIKAEEKVVEKAVAEILTHRPFASGRCREVFAR